MRRAKGAAVVVLAMGMLLSTPAWAAEKEPPGVQEVKGGVNTVQMADGAAGQPAARGELNESQRQAMEKLYQIVPGLKELTVEGVYDEGEGAWGVTLSNRSGKMAPGIMHTQASLSFKTGTDELLRFDIKSPDWASLEIPSAALAKEKAAEFARQVLGDKLKDYRMSDEIGFSGGGARDDKGNEINWNSARVRFEHLINGIPFVHSGIQVGVDAAGHVIDYYTEDFYLINEGMDYDEPELADFQAPSLAMSREAAEKVYAGLLEMKLNYVGRQPLQYPKYSGEDVETRPVLMYAPLTYAPIDAVTGKVLTGFQGQPKASLVSLTGEGKKMLAGTPEEAAALVAAETGIDVSGMKFNGAEEVGDYLESGVKVKQYSWSSEPSTGQDGKPDYRTMRYMYLSALADTGEIVSFNLQDESGHGDKTAVSREDAQKTAIQFIKRHLDRGAAEMEMYVYPAQEEIIPDWVDRSKLEGNEQIPVYGFSLAYMHQGIPVSDRTYSVSVDRLTGKITAFYCRDSGSSVSLPDSKNVVTVEAAKTEFLKSHPLRLVYFQPEYYDQKAPRPFLVYKPDNSGSMNYIDALTGKTVTVEMK